MSASTHSRYCGDLIFLHQIASEVEGESADPNIQASAVPVGASLEDVEDDKLQDIDWDNGTVLRASYLKLTQC